MNTSIIVLILIAVGASCSYLLETHGVKEPVVFYIVGALFGSAVGYLMND